MERDVIFSYRINKTILIVATIKPKPTGERNSILPGACSVSDGAQTGPQRPRIGSVRIGSGRSTLRPEGRACTELQQEQQEQITAQSASEVDDRPPEYLCMNYASSASTKNTRSRFQGMPNF